MWRTLITAGSGVALGCPAVAASAPVTLVFCCPQPSTSALFHGSGFAHQVSLSKAVGARLFMCTILGEGLTRKLRARASCKADCSRLGGPHFLMSKTWGAKDLLGGGRTLLAFIGTGNARRTYHPPSIFSDTEHLSRRLRQCILAASATSGDRNSHERFPMDIVIARAQGARLTGPICCRMM